MKTVLLTLIANLAISPAAAATPLDGTWTNPSRTITVRIGACGRAECGRVTSASAHARQAAAEAGTARLVGTEILTDIEQTGADSWHAQIFVPDENVRADGEITLESNNRLSVSGCKLGGLICKQQSWTRVAAPARHRR